MEDWNLYKTLLTVARTGTLLGAAEALGTSVSTVHRQLGMLETELDARLFERRGRIRVLTATGEALVARLGQIEEGIVGIERELAGADRAPRGKVTLTTTDTIADALLSRYLRTLRDRCPDVHLDVLVDNRHHRLGRGEADVALRPGRRPGEADVVAKQVASIAFAYYASRDYLERHGRPRRKRDLVVHDAVTSDESLAHALFLNAAAEQTDPKRRVLRSPSLLVQAMAVRRGIGVAALPCFLMDPHPDVERLFRPEGEVPLWVLYHADLRQTARVRTVVDVLVEGVTADQALIAGETG